MTEIKDEMINQLEEMRKVIGSQPMTVKRAIEFMDRFTNYIISYENIERSRDRWKERCLMLIQEKRRLRKNNGRKRNSA